MPVNRVDASELARAHQVERYGKAREGRGASQASPKDTSAHQPQIPVGDQAQISDKARALLDLRAALDVGRAAVDQEPQLREDRLQTVRERVSSGFYQSTAVREKVAGGLLNVMFGNDIL
jgi:hypothetical protein